MLLTILTIVYCAIIESTENLCGLYTSEDGRRQFGNPSLALRLGHHLKRLALVKQELSLRRDDEAAVKEAENFLRLHSSEWTDCIASNALNTLKRRKDNVIEEQHMQPCLAKNLRHFLT